MVNPLCVNIFYPKQSELKGTDPNKSRSEKNLMRSGKNRIVPENIQTINGDNSWVPSSVNGVRCIVLTLNRRECETIWTRMFSKKGIQFSRAFLFPPTSLSPKIKRIKEKPKAHHFAVETNSHHHELVIDYLFRHAAGFRCLLHRKDINHRAWWVCFWSYLQFVFCNPNKFFNRYYSLASRVHRLFNLGFVRMTLWLTDLIVWKKL